MPKNTPRRKRKLTLFLDPFLAQRRNLAELHKAYNSTPEFKNLQRVKHVSGPISRSKFPFQVIEVKTGDRKFYRYALNASPKIAMKYGLRAVLSPELSSFLRRLKKKK